MTISIRLGLVIGTGLCVAATAFAQVPPRPAAPQKPGSTPAQSPPVSVENRPAAPQVVTIVHRLSGIKMFRLLVRSGDQWRAITKVDDAFKLNSEVHTNVIAGYAMEDGTVIAWLPEAEAEMLPPPPPLGVGPPTTSRTPEGKAPIKPPSTTGTQAPSAPLLTMFFERPNLTVIPKTGQSITAQYVGIDGITGLSVLKVSAAGLVQPIDAAEEQIEMGQQVRLLAPEPARRPVGVNARIYVRMGEVDAKVSRITRAPSGGLSNVRISSTKLTPANIGGIAINEAGETLGIVDAVEGSEASIVPSTVVRSAAKRVLERKASVPRPWLGVRGEAVSALAVDQLRGRGWQSAEALALTEQRLGILLTSVAPGSPAAVAALKPGDVILRVNDDVVKTADDFSWLLQAVGPGKSARFTVAKPSQSTPEAVYVKLSESFDYAFTLRMFERLAKQSQQAASLLVHGIESIALQPEVAAQLGATGGVLVVSVRPGSALGKAGVRNGDVIEAINGEPVQASGSAVSLSAQPGTTHILDLVRDNQKFTLTYVVGSVR